jgi:putative acetyltransferase
MEFPLLYKSITLRPEQLTDVPKMKKFRDRLIDERTFIGSKEKRTLSDQKKSIENAISMMESHKAVPLIAEKDGEIVGLASIFMLRGKMDHFGGLGIMLDASVRKIGLATKMMEVIIQWGKEHLSGLECIELGVVPENLPAKKLYEKFDFRVVARLPKKLKHYGTYYDEEIMYLWLKK